MHAAMHEWDGSPIEMNCMVTSEATLVNHLVDAS